MNYWPDLTNFVNIHVNFNTMCTDRASQDSATTSAPLDHMKSLESINWIGTCEEYIRRTVYIPTAEVANGKLRPIYFGIEFTQVRWWRKKRFQTHVRSDSRHRKGRITFWKYRPCNSRSRKFYVLSQKSKGTTVSTFSSENQKKFCLLGCQNHNSY
jgi:hypothetical protein